MTSLNSLLVGPVARLPWRVQTKLLAAFLAIVVLLIALGACGLYELSRVNQHTEALINSERKIAAYRQVQHDTTNQLYSISSALLVSDQRALDSALRQLNQFGYDLERLQFVAKDEIELLRKVRQEYDRFIAVATRVVELIRNGHGDEAREAQLKEARPLADRLEKKRLLDEVHAEQERSEALLLNILPRTIVERMRRGETVIADRVDEATILFADLVDFTSLAARSSPEKTVALLGDVFSRFDSLAARYGLEKIKTTGDGYMLAGGVPEERTDHAAAVAEMALAMLDAIETAGQTAREPLQLRIGLNTGALTAGVLGTHKFVYDVWGDTVNIAKRMESYGLSGRVHVSAATRKALGNAFRFEPRGALEVKGKGSMETYFLYRR
jgi:class 3 adenylate cyclase